jgi:hypothetical protein
MSKSTLLSGLEEVFEWRKEREGYFDQKENEISARERHINEQLEQLNTQMAELQNHREETWNQRSLLNPQEQEKCNQAVQNGMKDDNNVISERDVFYQEFLREREERVLTLISSPSISKKVKEFEQFQDTHQQFDTLPESYRSVIIKHHNEVRAELNPIFTAFAEPLRILDDEQKNIGLLATLDPQEGPPEALALTLPIPFNVYTDLSTAEESLHHLLAYRCCAAVSSMLLKVGVPNAPIQFVEYCGMISIRVWLGDHKVAGDVKKILQQELQALEKNSSEMKSVQLGLDVAWISLEALMGEGE